MRRQAKMFKKILKKKFKKAKNFKKNEVDEIALY